MARSDVQKLYTALLPFGNDRYDALCHRLSLETFVFSLLYCNIYDESKTTYKTIGDVCQPSLATPGCTSVSLLGLAPPSFCSLFY